MNETPQTQAIRNYRSRLKGQGRVRFEVLGSEKDRDLIRSLARELMEDGPEAARLRMNLQRSLADEPTAKGGILKALRKSPLVGADLELERPVVIARTVDL